MVTLSPARTRMRLRRSLPARWARTIRSCSSCTLNSPLGNFSNTVPVTSMLSSLLINLHTLGETAGARSTGRSLTASAHCDVGRLQAFGPFGHLKLHSGAFIQALITLGLNRREVYEDIFSILPLDKTVALGRVEPLHCTFFFHLPIFLLFENASTQTGRKQEKGARTDSRSPLSALSPSGKQESNAIPLYNRRTVQNPAGLATQFEFYRFRFHFRAIDPVYFPVGKSGNVIRGALGMVLRDTASPAAYARLFEPGRSEER